MEFFDMVQKLQIIYGLKIILISCGNFYISIGADAVVLNKELGLKLNCAKKGLCKVGVPKNSIDKYIKKLNELGYSYIVLDYKKDENKIIKQYEKQEKIILINILKTCSISIDFYRFLCYTIKHSKQE